MCTSQKADRSCTGEITGFPHGLPGEEPHVSIFRELERACAAAAVASVRHCSGAHMAIASLGNGFVGRGHVDRPPLWRSSPHRLARRRLEPELGLLARTPQLNEITRHRCLASPRGSPQCLFAVLPAVRNLKRFRGDKANRGAPHHVRSGLLHERTAGVRAIVCAAVGHGDHPIAVHALPAWRCEHSRNRRGRGSRTLVPAQAAGRFSQTAS
jgi:hypothetical protein